MAQYQTGADCVNTQLEAAQYQANQNEGATVQIGTNQYIISVTSVTASNITYVFNRVSGTPNITKSITPTFQPCTKLTPQDSIDLAWLVVGVWVATYAIKVLFRAVSPNFGAQP